MGTNPSTWNLYAYCANSPVNYEDPSGHIAISRIIGGVIGGGIGFLAGRKIAKKTKAKGWKKYAIIAGCTIGGAAIGALAGPRVAKVAKKAARLIKRKIPSRHIQKIQRVWNVTKKVARKAVTKTRNAISKGKSRTISKRIGKIATSALFNLFVSAVNNRQNKQTNIQTFKTTGFGAMQGAMSLGYDTLKVFAGTSGFQVGSCIIRGVDYPNDFAFGLLDAGTM